MNLPGRFLADAAAGSILLLPLAPRRVVGGGFHRLSIGVAASAGIVAVAVAGAGAFAVEGPADALRRAASALVLGASIQAMLLGHWYLVRPAMEIHPFVRYHGVLLAALALRIAAGAPGWPVAWAAFEAPDVWTALLVSARVLIGYVAVGIGAAMSLGCARIRSTQSATGILYVVLLWVVAGELLGGRVGV